ncbi:MAG: glutathione S-transferase N-terminal domain-containing protein, partial [Pseudomonadota bacterium]
MITVYGRATSSNVQVVMWALAELGLKPERLDYGHVHGGLDTPDFRALTPHGKVPVLRDGDLVVWESGAILRYLCARYGSGTAFWPEDPGARARVDMWAEWGKAELCRGFTVPIFWSRVRTAAARARDMLMLASRPPAVSVWPTMATSRPGRSCIRAASSAISGEGASDRVVVPTANSMLSDAPSPEMAELAALMQDRPGLEVAIVGHTDTAGGLD